MEILHNPQVLTRITVLQTILLVIAKIAIQITPQIKVQMITQTVIQVIVQATALVIIQAAALVVAQAAALVVARMTVPLKDLLQEVEDYRKAPPQQQAQKQQILHSEYFYGVGCEIRLYLSGMVIFN